MKTSRRYILLYLRGVGMGMADMAPGISGGTVAFVTGIYEELIYTIKKIDMQAMRLLVKLQWAALWKKINGPFVVSVLAGVATSVIFFSRLMSYLIARHPIPTWSFFFGLIAASVPLLLRGATWRFSMLLMGLLGMALAYWVTVASPIKLSAHPLVVFLCGMPAICAMILPGISGAFVLLLLGQYRFLLQAIGHADIPYLLAFAAGCIVGLLLFSRLLSWLLAHYHNATLFLLAGFTLGALNKVWPWQYAASAATFQNVWPAAYFDKTGLSPQLSYAAFFAILGILIVIFTESLAASKKTNQ